MSAQPRASLRRDSFADSTSDFQRTTGGRSRNRIVAYCAAIIYASVVVFLPWSLLTGTESFIDFDRYVATFTDSASPSLSVDGWSALREFFTNEVLWGMIVRWLTGIVGDVSTALRVLSFFVCMVWGVYLFSRIPIGWAVLFLLNPRSIEVALSQVRNGLAWSLFILGLATAQPMIRIALFCLTPFIHSSVAALLVLYSFTGKVAPKIKNNLTAILCIIGVGVAVGLALSVFNQIVVGSLGDRRVGEAYVTGGGSLLQSSFWVIVFITQLTCGAEYIRRNALVVSLIAWYLVMNPFIPWSHRLWGAFIPVIAVSIWNLPRSRRLFILYCWTGYLIVWYIYWTNAINYL